MKTSRNSHCWVKWAFRLSQKSLYKKIVLKLIQTFEAKTSFQKIFQCRKNERGTLQSRPVLQRHEN